MKEFISVQEAKEILKALSLVRKKVLLPTKIARALDCRSYVCAHAGTLL